MGRLDCTTNTFDDIKVVIRSCKSKDKVSSKSSILVGLKEKGQKDK